MAEGRKDGDVNQGNSDWSLVPCGDELSADVFSTDYSDLFITYNLFGSKNELVEWVHSVARPHHMVVVVKRSDNGGGTKKSRVFLACERGGVYRPYKEKFNRFKPDEDKSEGDKGDGKKGRKAVPTRKCNCPFMLKGKELEIDGPWVLEVVSAVHNHSLPTYLQGHSYIERLTKEEEDYVVEMSMDMIKPKNMMSKLQKKFPANVSSIRTLYNARAKNRVNDRAGRSQMQYLMGKLEECHYYYLYRRCEASGEVTDLFMAHHTSIELIRAFPQVLLMDCTYKTNMYNMPLLEIVGVTSTDLTFCVARVYLKAEKEENYTWACNTLRALMDENCLPSVIVTDREMALMNAVASIFPGATHLLCRWHINKNILVNTKKHIRNKEECDGFIAAWNLVVFADTEEMFHTRLNRLQDEFAHYPKAIDYAMKQWIHPYKDRFASFLTNKVKHYANTTNNRAESQHAVLKKQLQSSQGNFETNWFNFHTLMEASQTAIKASFERSINLVQHKYRVVTFQMLRGMVSSTALKLIFDELADLNEGVMEADLCKCKLRTTCGLPCAHELSEYVSKRLPVPLELCDDFWRKLDLKPRKEDDELVDEVDSKWDAIIANAQQKYQKGCLAEREMYVRRFMEATNPTTTSLTEPSLLKRNRGRPKTAKKKDSTKRDPSAFEFEVPSCSPLDSGFYDTGPGVPKAMFSTTTRPRKQKVVRTSAKTKAHATSFIDVLPPQFRDFIMYTKDVDGDGHCGFRAIADLLGHGEESWSVVRSDLMHELGIHEGLYKLVFLEEGSVERTMNTLNCFESFAPQSKWFCLPEMGHLIATTYNVAFVVLSPQISLTFLPLLTGKDEPPKIISIGLVNNNHFVQVFLRDNSPLPPIVRQWTDYHSDAAETWRSFITPRVEALQHMSNKSGDKGGPSWGSIDLEKLDFSDSDM